VTASDALDRPALDAAVATVRAAAGRWARLGIAERIGHLRATRANLIAVADAWVAAAARAKAIDGSPLEGEEWLSGPYPVLAFVDALIATLDGIARDGTPPIPASAVRTRTATDGAPQLVVTVFPATPSDGLLLNGVRADVWMQPGVTRENLREHVASFYRDREPSGAVTLVLGAGNVAAIPALDLLTAMYAHGHAVVLKLNPVNAYLAPVFAQLFTSLIDEGFVRIVEGAADAGAYLCAHAAIDAIHLTGGERTHDAIVFGAGEDGEARKRDGTPVVTKPVTSELGNVTPVIVVPGPWSDADVRFQAAHVATAKLHNAGANCIAAQVLVTPRTWRLRDAFVAAVRDALASSPPRPSYYPGSRDRVRDVEQAHPEAEFVGVPIDGIHRTFVTNLDAANAAEPLFRTEAFGPVLAETPLDGDDAATFLRNAVDFCNERLRGTLGAALLIHPRTVRELGDAFDDALERLRYGTVTVNTWPGVGFSLATATWGAYPGNTLADVGSGIGVVHNAYLFDDPQKTVVRAPFAPFPRSLGNGERTLLPTPPWFVTHRRANAAGRALFAYAANPSPLRLAATVLAAMRA
jgi:aldehyde dehydrogenase (NAD(P)+)